MTNAADGAPIDLRSDTVTRPTDAMLEAMRTAPLGDDSRDGDPTVVRLERMAAERLGKEAALFLPSGTMGNLVAALGHVGRGQEIVIDPLAHVLVTETASLVGVAGAVPRVVDSDAGRYDLGALERALATPASRLGIGLVWLETSHNWAGGRVLPIDHIAEVSALARRHGVPLHMDGARIFNAAAALGVSAADVARPADTVMFCISKGLSAPVGSLLAGSADFIARARALRRMIGGAMRQAGVIAAAGIVALDTMVERLADDHAVARRLADGLAALDPSLIDPATVETNILRVDLARTRHDATTWAKGLAAAGVIVPAGSGTTQMRLVTHRHVDMAAAERVIAAFRGLA
jgi:threonine aldolase